MDEVLPIKTQISHALRRGDAPEVARLLREHPESLEMETGYGGWLHKAAAYGNLEVVKVCVAAGIHPNAPPPGGLPPESALFDAVSSGSADVVRWLLENGAKSECVAELEDGAPRRNFALCQACEDGRLDMVEMLVEYGADVNVYYGGRTPLLWAEAHGHKDLVKYLRSKGAKRPDELGLGPKNKPKES
jgi:ankyrin repeat protein